MFTNLLAKILMIKTALGDPGDDGLIGGGGGHGGLTGGGDLTGNSAVTDALKGLTPTKELGPILNDIIGYSAGLAISIAALMIIYAGYQILTSGGDTEKYETGKKTITYAVVGLIVIFLSATVIGLIRFLFGV